MSIVTPINGFQLPTLGDNANIESAVQPLGQAVDSVVIPRFTTTAARDTAITAPTFGQMCAVSGTGELYYYNGVAWAGVVERFVRKTADQTVTSNTTLQNDNHLIWAAEANSRYKVEYVLFGTSTTASGDFKCNWTLPAGGTRKTAMTALSEGATLNFDSCFMEWATSADHIGGMINGFCYYLIKGQIITSSTAGNVTFRWAQDTSNAAGTTLTADSYCTILKVG